MKKILLPLVLLFVSTVMLATTYKIAIDQTVVDAHRTVAGKYEVAFLGKAGRTLGTLTFQLTTQGQAQIVATKTIKSQWAGVTGAGIITIQVPPAISLGFCVDRATVRGKEGPYNNQYYQTGAAKLLGCYSQNFRVKVVNGVLQISRES